MSEKVICAGCGAVRPEKDEDARGWTNCARDGKTVHSCPACLHKNQVSAFAGSTWEFYAALKKGLPVSHESGFEIREDITDDGLLAAAATLAATMWGCE